MGSTYQELKRNKKNSTVLEKRENIEIQKTSAGYSKTKKTFIRERFFDRPYNTSTVDSYEGNTPLQDMKLETKENPNIRRYLSKRKVETWAEHLANNKCRERMQNDLEIAKERFSLQHQCICVSPRYANDKDLKPRPRMRSIGSQMTAREKYVDKGAVGDHSSFLKLKLETDKNFHSEEKLKADLQKVIPTITNKDHAITCYCGIIEQPLCHYCASHKPMNNDSTCHQQSCHPISPIGNSQFTYCWDEFYYDCENCRCNPKCAECQKKARSTNQNRRQRTDLDTEHFYSRPIERSGAVDESSKRKTKTFNKSRELNVEHGRQYKKREYEMRKEERNKRPRSKSKEANEKKSLKGETICSVLGEDKVSEILKYIDRYIDDHESELKLEQRKAAKKSNNCSTQTSVKLNRERNLYQDTISQNRQDSDTITQFIERHGCLSQEPVCSLETLKMLKQMKIYEYKPKKPKEKSDENNSRRNRETMNKYKQQQKEENYKKYLQKYSKEIETPPEIKVLKEAPKTLRKLESEETNMSKKDKKEDSREYDLKDEAIKVNTDETNSYSDQNSSRNCESNVRRDASLLGYDEEHIHSSEEISCRHDRSKGVTESWYDENELKRTLYQKFGEIYQDFVEVAKADFNQQKHFTERSNYCNADYKELKGKAEKTPETEIRYDFNKVRDYAKQKQLATTLSKDQYVDKTLEGSKENLKSPLGFQPKNSDNTQKFKESIGYKPDSQRDSIEREQYPVESLREGVSKGIYNEQEHKESKDETQKNIATQNGHESEENYETINEEQIKRSLDLQPEIIREYKFKDKLTRGAHDNEKKKQSSFLQSEREQEKATFNMPETYKKQTNAKTSKQNEDEKTELEGSLSPKLIAAADTKQKEITSAPENNKFYSLEQKNGNFSKQNSKEYGAKEFDQIEQKTHSSTNNDFKQAVDYNLGSFIHRSSQTENHFNGQVSKQTFTEELNLEQEISDRHCTLEEALNYLEEYLKSHTQSTKEEHSSVLNTVHDLVTKLSSLTHQALTSQEDLKEPTQSSEDRLTYTVEKKRTQDTQYEDPLSSDLRFELQTKEEGNASTLADSIDSQAQLERKGDSYLSAESHKQELESSHVTQDTQIENIEKELVTNDFVEQKSYQDPTQADLQQQQSSDIYQRYQSCEKNLYNLEQLEECSTGQATNYEAIDKQPQSCEPDTESQHLHKDFSSSSRQVDFDANLMPSKSILKPCRMMETPETYQTESVVSFHPKDEIHIQAPSLMNCDQQKEEMGQQVHESPEGIVAKDSISKQSDRNLTETQNQPIYSQYQLESHLAVPPYYGARNNSPISYTVGVPAFEQCPCMWETYEEMLRNFYKGKQKQLLMQS